jgi:hypothetical protein
LSLYQKLVQVTLKFTQKKEDEDGGYDLSRESQFINKWGGYTEIIWLLAGGDITKMKEIYKLNCHEFFITSMIKGK